MCYTPRMLRASPVLPCLLLAALQLLPATDVEAKGGTQHESPWARTERDEDLAVKLVTFGAGDAVHQYFGHNALIVEDTRREMQVMYNFGMFGFGADMLPKYLQGQLEFWVAATPVRRTFRHYASMNRSIRVVELDLSPASRRRLADRLAWWALPENRNYRYHHYRDNCSTKLRDLLDEAVGGQLREQQSKPSRLDYRGHTWRYTEHDPFVHFLLILWMNDSMEAPIHGWHDAFLPDELERIVLETRYRDEQGRERALAQQSYTVFEAKRADVPRDPGVRVPGVLGAGVLMGAVAVLLGWLARRRGKLARALFGLHHMVAGVIAGVPGLVLFLFLFTEWKVTHWNENLWLTNPLTFAALPFGVAIAFGSRAALRRMERMWLALVVMGVLALLLKVLPNYDQNNWVPFALLLPLNIGFALGSRRAMGKGLSRAQAPAEATAQA